MLRLLARGPTGLQVGVCHAALANQHEQLQWWRGKAAAADDDPPTTEYEPLVSAIEPLQRNADEHMHA
jgi:hypothetical protein